MCHGPLLVHMPSKEASRRVFKLQQDLASYDGTDENAGLLKTCMCQALLVVMGFIVHGRSELGKNP